MYHINQQQLDDLLLGATALATGGGCLYEQKKSTLVKVGITAVSVLEASDIRASDLLCTVYAVGSTSIQESSMEKRLRIGCREVEKKLGSPLTAFFVGELGAEHLALMASAILGVGILDADGTGGRAVPEIMQDQFALVGRKTTPAIVVKADGNVIIFEDLEPQTLERNIREITLRTNSLVLVFDHFMRGGDVQILSCGNLKRSMQIGEILRHRDRVALLSHGFTFVDEARMDAIKIQPSPDFFRADVTLSGRKGTYHLLIKNENLVLLRNGEPIITCPHLIMLLDEEARPVHNARIQEAIGTTLTIASVKALPNWQTKQANELFSPKRFGFNYKVVYRPALQ